MNSGEKGFEAVFRLEPVVAVVEAAGAGQGALGHRVTRIARIAMYPSDYRAMTSIAEGSAWRGDWKRAIEWG
ncbi:MAG: hypothetical protein ABIT82_05640, partial [Ramlibacter sp.]